MSLPDPRPVINLYQQQQRRHRLRLLLLLLVVAVLSAADLLSGPAHLSLLDLMRALLSATPTSSLDATIIFQIRIPQTLLALLVGAALGLAGAEMQTVLDNPLASPFTLGVSSAAALGAALSLMLGLTLPGTTSGQSTIIASLIAAGLCTALLDLTARKSRAGPQGIVLFGIALVFSINALISLIQYLVDANALQNLIFWLMGSVARATTTNVLLMAMALLLCLLWAYGQAWKMTALAYGDARATSLGVDVRSVRRQSLLRVSLLTALAVAFTGVIGFIGLVAPHIARRVIGQDHRWFLPASALTGAALLLAASTLAKQLASETVLPVGIVTTLVGIPVFAFIVLRRQTA